MIIASTEFEMVNKVDLDHDGKVSREEIEQFQRLNELNRDEQRDQNHIKLAWTAMISIVVVTLLLFTPFVSIEKINALKDILDLFYIAQTSIIGFYMGAKTYLDRNK